MPITGNLAEFSLPAIFQFLERQQGTGLLLIQPSSARTAQEKQRNYVWLHKGRIVAVADALDNQGLASLISQRGWLKQEEIRQITGNCPCSSQTPIGVCLRHQGALSAEQLRLLFYISVLLRVCALFKLKEGRFVFDTTALLPREEMTGISLSATAATLVGLRVLRDWAAFAAKLPPPETVLCKVVSSQPRLQMDSQERQVWSFANGKVSLDGLANQLHLSINTVQQIAYRLSMVGLVEEVVSIAPAYQPSDRESAVVERATLNLAAEERAQVQNRSQAFSQPQALGIQPSAVKPARQPSASWIESSSPLVIVSAHRKKIGQTLVSST